MEKNIQILLTQEDFTNLRLALAGHIVMLERAAPTARRPEIQKDLQEAAASMNELDQRFQNVWFATKEQ